MGGIGAFVRRKWGEVWEVTERMYGAIGENSIDFLKILYRLFPDTSVQPLERHRINDLIVWEHRSASSVEKGTKVRGNKGEGALRWGGFPIEIREKCTQEQG